MIKDILIATILPNGTHQNGFRFSLCLDFNRNIDPATCTPQALGQVLANMPALLDALHKGFLLDIDGTAITVNTIEFTGTDSQAADIRKAAWSTLFANPVGAAGLTAGKNMQQVAALGNVNDISAELRALHGALITGQRDSVAQVATRMIANLSQPVQSLRENLRAIHNYSEIEGKRAKENYYRSLQSTGTGMSALEAERTTLSMEQLLDITGMITENNLLQRLTGFTVDFRIPFAALTQQQPRLKLSVPADHAWAGSIMALTSQMQQYSRPAGAVLRRIVLLKGTNAAYSGIYSSADLQLFNHDRLAKSDALEQVMKTITAATLTTDAGKEELLKKLRKIDTNTATVGLALYHDGWAGQLNDAGKDAAGNELLQSHPAVMAGEKLVKDAFLTIDPATVLQENNVIKGHRFGRQTSNTTFVSLGTRKCRPVFKLPNGPVVTLPEVQQDFCVNTDTGMETFNDATGEVRPIVDETLFNWSGENLGLPSAFASMEKEEELPPSNDEGGMDASTQAALEKIARFMQEEFFPYNVKISKPGAPPPLMVLRYEPVRKSNPRLVFGDTYHILMVNEYKNGWGLSFSNAPDSPEMSAADMFALAAAAPGGFTLPRMLFKRNEPVKPIAVFPVKRLLNQAQTASAPGMEGESLHHLVIRSTGPHSVQHQSERYLLPPQISFQHAFWHNKIFEMSPEDSYRWYLRYHDPESKALAMPPENAHSRLRPNYLWDPLVKGFTLEFFLDREHRHRAAGYYRPDGTPFQFSFDTGAYPLVAGFRVQLMDDMDDGRAKITPLLANAGVRIYLAQGEELYCVVRTVLHDAFASQLETYGYVDAGTPLGKNDWLTPPQQLRLTHACKKPLVTPRFIAMEKEVTRPRHSTVVDFTVRAHIEHLNLYQEGGVHKYLSGTLPTGELELYATWDEYLDDPQQFRSGDPGWTPEQVFRSRQEQELSFECKVALDQQLADMSNAVTGINNPQPNTIKNFTTELRIGYDVKDMRHIVKHYVLKNKSSFAAFYPKEANDRNFSALSAAFAVHVPCNRKPAPPAVHHILPLLVTDESVTGNAVTKTTMGNRFRIFFERGRLTSGEGERIAFLVHQLQGTYNELFQAQDLLSVTGRDITADGEKPTVGNPVTNPRVYLESGNFTMNDPTGTTPSDLTIFAPQYVRELGMVTYAPKFDRGDDLWYVDVDLKVNNNGRWLHSAFVLLSAAHYQQYAVNHNAAGEKDMAKDCRFSDLIKVPPVYILPPRTVTVTRVSGRRVTVKLTCDESSLIAAGAKKKTVFLAIVQASDDGVEWVTAQLEGAGGNDAYRELSPAFGQTVQLDYTPTRDHHRLLVLEVEAFNRNFVLPEKFTDVQEDKQNRIVFIQTYNI